MRGRPADRSIPTIVMPGNADREMPKGIGVGRHNWVSFFRDARWASSPWSPAINLGCRVLTLDSGHTWAHVWRFDASCTHRDQLAVFRTIDRQAGFSLAPYPLAQFLGLAAGSRVGDEDLVGKLGDKPIPLPCKAGCEPVTPRCERRDHKKPILAEGLAPS